MFPAILLFLLAIRWSYVMRTNAPALLLLILAAGCARGPQPPANAELIAMLQKDDPKVQLEAAAWITELGPKAAETKPALIALLKSPHGSVRQSAAAALAQLGPDAADAVPALAGILSDPEYSVRKAGADALAQFGPAASSAIPALEASSKQPDPCNATAAALKKIRP